MPLPALSYIFFVFWGTHLAMVRVYSWLRIQDNFWQCSEDHTQCLGIKSWLAARKASSLAGSALARFIQLPKSQFKTEDPKLLRPTMKFTPFREWGPHPAVLRAQLRRLYVMPGIKAGPVSHMKSNILTHLLSSSKLILSESSVTSSITVLEATTNPLSSQCSPWGGGLSPTLGSIGLKGKISTRIIQLD